MISQLSQSLPLDICKGFTLDDLIKSYPDLVYSVYW